MAREPIVFADTNTLVGTLLRNILIELALAGAINLHWSPQVMAELGRTLARVQKRTEPDIADLTSAMNAILPSAMVDRDSSLTMAAILPHANDQGILADAVTAECDVLLTFNLRHFPATALTKLDLPLRAEDPDKLLVTLITTQPIKTFSALRAAQAAFRAPPLNRPAFLALIRKIGLPQSSELLAHLGEP
jgi:predicted nucleic acid-binding protein